MGFADREKSRSSCNVVASMIEPQPESGPVRGRPKAARETKKRFSLALLPSVYEDALKIAFVDRTSVSEIVSEFLKRYVSENAKKLQEYDKIKEK